MKKVLADIQDGSFAKRFLDEMSSGAENLSWSARRLESFIAGPTKINLSTIKELNAYNRRNTTLGVIYFAILRRNLRFPCSFTIK